MVGVGTLASHGPAIADAGRSPGRPSEPLYLQGSALPRSSVPASLRFFKDRRSLAAPFSLHLSSVLNFRLSLEITLSLVMFLFRVLLTFSRHQLPPRFIEADQPCGSAAYSAIVRRQLCAPRTTYPVNSLPSQGFPAVPTLSTVHSQTKDLLLVDEKRLREKKRRRNKENKNCSQCVRLSSHTSVNLCSLGAIGQQCSRRENAGPFMKVF